MEPLSFLGTDFQLMMGRETLTIQATKAHSTILGVDIC